jgi:group I intron endonuclease
MIIYKITNKINKKIYIGQTIQKMKDRFYRHIWNAKHKKNASILLENAIRKYGEENFIIEQIDKAKNIEELNEKEIYWIKKLISNNKIFGYNLMSGGVNPSHSKQTIKKFKKSRKGKKAPMYGKHHTENAKEKIGAANRGKTFSKEHRKKIGDIHRGKKVSKKSRMKMSASRSGEKHWLYGGHLPEEQKQYLSKINTGHNHPQFGKPKSKKTKKKISEAQIGSKNHMYGKFPSRETRNKLSALYTIQTPYNNNEIIEILGSKNLQKYFRNILYSGYHIVLKFLKDKKYNGFILLNIKKK